jgi:hypothetical protein
VLPQIVLLPALVSLLTTDVSNWLLVIVQPSIRPHWLSSPLPQPDPKSFVCHRATVAWSAGTGAWNVLPDRTMWPNGGGFGVQ